MSGRLFATQKEHFSIHLTFKDEIQIELIQLEIARTYV